MTGAVADLDADADVDIVADIAGGPADARHEVPPFGSDGYESAMNEVTGHLNAQHARLVELTVALLANEHRWVESGVHTPELFLAWRAGLSAQHARQVVAIARRIDELPVSVTAFARGELSLDQMAAIAHRAPWWADAEVCELATYLTVAQLRNTLGKYPFPEIPHPDALASGDGTDGPATADEPDGTGVPAAELPALGDDPNADPGPGEHESDVAAPGVGGRASPPVESRVWWGVGDDGVFRLHAECDPVAGMIIEAALSEARDALFHDGRHDVDDVDALVEIAHRSLDHVDDAGRRDRFRASIHLHTDRPATDAHGHALPDVVRRHVTCDGVLSPVFYANGAPVSVGRSQRIVPARTRRLVTLRDQACRVPGCDRRRHLDIHHIIHWEHDGATDTGNLIALCPQHHRLHHQGRLGITGDADRPDGVEFTDHRGRPLTASGARPTPPGAPPPPPAGAYHHPLGERLDTRWLTFNPPREHRRHGGRLSGTPSGRAQ